MSLYEVQEGTLLEGFEDSTEWSISGGTAANDTSFFKTGSKSLKLTGGVGTNCIATKTINADLSESGLIYMWVYIPVLADVLSIQIILGNDSAFSNFYSKTFTSVLHEGWNKLPIGKTQWASTGSPSWGTTFERLRVRVNSNTDLTGVAYFDSLTIGFYSRPKCIISFDDGWATQYTEGYEYMKKYRFRGSLYLIKQRIDTANYMTTAQVQTLFDAGWDVMNHTDNHVNMATELSTQAEVELELSACRDWIRGNKWSRKNGELHVAYPNGGYDTKVLAAMANLGMITGRTIINRTQANEIDSQFLLCRQSHAYTATAATYKAYIDRTIAEGGCIQLNYHKIVADAAGAADTEVEQSQFRGIIDYIASKREQIDVVTFTEWYEGLSNSRKGKSIEYFTI